MGRIKFKQIRAQKSLQKTHLHEEDKEDIPNKLYSYMNVLEIVFLNSIEILFTQTSVNAQGRSYLKA